MNLDNSKAETIVVTVVGAIPQRKSDVLAIDFNIDGIVFKHSGDVQGGAERESRTAGRGGGGPDPGKKILTWALERASIFASIV